MDVISVDKQVVDKNHVLPTACGDLAQKDCHMSLFCLVQETLKQVRIDVWSFKCSLTDSTDIFMCGDR